MSESKTPIANIFGSKVLRSEPKRSDKKNLIWDYFIQSDKNGPTILEIRDLI